MPFDRRQHIQIYMEKRLEPKNEFYFIFIWYTKLKANPRANLIPSHQKKWKPQTIQDSHHLKCLMLQNKKRLSSVTILVDFIIRFSYNFLFFFVFPPVFEQYFLTFQWRMIWFCHWKIWLWNYSWKKMKLSQNMNKKIKDKVIFYLWFRIQITIGIETAYAKESVHFLFL